MLYYKRFKALIKWYGEFWILCVFLGNMVWFFIWLSIWMLNCEIVGGEGKMHHCRQ